MCKGRLDTTNSDKHIARSADTVILGSLSMKLYQQFIASLIGLIFIVPQLTSAANCMQDFYQTVGQNGQQLNCNANDVKIAKADNIRDLNGNTLSQCISGQKFSFIADFTVELSVQARYDVGLYFAIDGDNNNDGALTGMCSTNVISQKTGGVPDLGSSNFVQLDGEADICGDVTESSSPQVVTVQVDDVSCQDSDGDGLLNLPNCASWRQPGSNEVCTSSSDAYPGSPSKCNCDIDFNIPVFVEVGTISVEKTVSPLTLPEPGGVFTFTVNITNQAMFSDIIIDRICDSDHGEIARMDGTEPCAAGTIGTIQSTTCALPLIISPESSGSCTFTAEVTSNVPTIEQDLVIVSGADANGNPVSDTDTAQIEITDVPPTAVVEKNLENINCVNATYNFKVTNTSTVEDLKLTKLIDSKFGDITVVSDSVTATNCEADVVISKNNGAYTCKIDANFCGTEHTNRLTATLVDDEGNQISDESASVNVIINATQQ